MKMKAYLSNSSHPDLISYIKSSGYDIHLVSESMNVSVPIASHADLFMCQFMEKYRSYILHYDKNKDNIMPGYPYEIPFNALSTGKFFIHNLKYTNQRLLEFAKSKNLKLVDVNQGYTKCSTVLVDENSIITDDNGIYQASISAGLDVLKVEKGFVNLDGYKYGFIGGASGNNGKEIIFNGNLENHPSYAAILAFIINRGMEVKYFTGYPLTDIGSIIFEY